MAKKQSAAQAAEAAAHDGPLWRKDFSLRRRLFDAKKVPDLFEAPERLLEQIQGYFLWSDASPYQEERIELYRGNYVRGKVPHMRAYTKQGCCAFIGIKVSQWDKWRAGDVDCGPPGSTMEQSRRPLVEQVTDILEWAETIMYEQKFTGAAAGMLNANIIVRDLKLTDKQEASKENSGAVDTTEELAEFNKQLAKLGEKGQKAKPK